jgi:hypothetical protein
MPRNRELMLSDLVPCRELVTVPTVVAFMSGGRGHPRLLKGTLEDMRLAETEVWIRKVPGKREWEIKAVGRIDESVASRLVMLQAAVDRAVGKAGW